MENHNFFVHNIEVFCWRVISHDIRWAWPIAQENQISPFQVNINFGNIFVSGQMKGIGVYHPIYAYYQGIMLLNIGVAAWFLELKRKRSCFLAPCAGYVSHVTQITLLLFVVTSHPFDKQILFWDTCSDLFHKGQKMSLESQIFPCRWMGF